MFEWLKRIEKLETENEDLKHRVDCLEGNHEWNWDFWERTIIYCATLKQAKKVKIHCIHCDALKESENV